ncbi:MAG: T9SS type A sorting domain-containing protein [Bacteroidetes bacterium]|nr:T9SS type A sorting domain-containing protein [Bacteroidota bacterium]
MFAQVVVTTESFDATTYPPTGWSIKPALGANNVWIRQTSPTTNPTTTSHSGAAVSRFRSRNVAAGTKQILVTRAIDYTNRGTNTATLSFWMFRDSFLVGNLDSLTVWVNSTDTLDAGAVKLGTIARNRTINIPDTQSVNGWYLYVYSIPVSFTGTTTRFIFEGTGESAVVNSGANIFIDDVFFDEYPAICTGTPSVGNIVTPSPVLCGGSGSALLSLSAPINGVLGITYNWESSASSTGPWTGVGTNPTYNTGIITSTTYYQCTVNCSFSSLSYTTPVDSVVVSSNTPPTVTIASTTNVFCAGDSMGVELIAGGADTYLWTPAATLNVNNNDTVYASPTANTQYTVLGTDLNGCSDTAMINISYNAGPTVNITATPNDTVCAGTQVILNSVPTGVTGNVYLWSDGITSRRDTIILNATTAYWVTVTNAAGCSNSDSALIVATDPTVANFGYTSNGATYTFSDSSILASNWTWSFGDGNGSTNQNPVYTYSAPGTYTVTLIVTGVSCNDDTITMVINVWATDLNDIDKDIQVSIYPNPAQNNLQISLTNQVIDEVVIRNQMGEKVMSFTNSTASQEISLPVNHLAKGMYFAEVTSNGKLIPIKFLKD